MTFLMGERTCSYNKQLNYWQVQKKIILNKMQRHGSFFKLSQALLADVCTFELKKKFDSIK